MNGSNLLYIGIIIAFLGIGLQIALGESSTFLGGALSTAGIIIAIRGYLLQKNPQKLKKDERSRKIGAWAASYSWIITIIVLMVLFWINKLNLFPLSIDTVIGLIYLTMIVSLVVYKHYFNNKGDIE